VYAPVVFCGMYPVSLAEERKKITASFLSFCSYQVDDTLNFPADKNFVQLPTAESPQVLICLTGGFILCPSHWHRIVSARV